MSNIKYCDNCNYLVHDSAKGDLCLACEKEQSPPEPERFSDYEIERQLTWLDNSNKSPEHDFSIIAGIIRQLQARVKELEVELETEFMEARIETLSAELEGLTPVYYITQETAFAPGIVKEWPDIIPLPGNKNGRLVKKLKRESTGEGKTPTKEESE